MKEHIFNKAQIKLISLFLQNFTRNHETNKTRDVNKTLSEQQLLNSDTCEMSWRCICYNVWPFVSREAGHHFTCLDVLIFSYDWWRRLFCSWMGQKISVLLFLKGYKCHNPWSAVITSTILKYISRENFKNTVTLHCRSCYKINLSFSASFMFIYLRYFRKKSRFNSTNKPEIKNNILGDIFLFSWRKAESIIFMCEHANFSSSRL